MSILKRRVRSGDVRPIILVAHERPGSEHLGIRMVAAALLDAGYRPRIVELLSLSGVSDLVARTLAGEEPLLVGLSISDPLVAPLMLTFARCLRQAGYAGHVTAGGALATVLRADLLREQPALNSIIRHAGEAPAVALARSLAHGTSLAEVPGLTTREGDGCANLLSPSLARQRPLRASERPRLLGIPAADVSASRGCASRCAYCGVAALQRDLESEWFLPGAHPPGSRRHAGVLRRPADDVADEVAELYRRYGVRVVRFVDDNLLGSDESQALPWLAKLEHGLVARRIGPMAFRLMAEPRVITDAVADALCRIGFVSILVGLESLTDEGLKGLGRAGQAADHLRALERLTARGIAPVVNVLALRPGGSLAATRSELNALVAIDHIAWDVLPLMAWPGTRLAEDLAARGELAGRGLGISWRPPTVAAERFLFAVERLRASGSAWLARHPNLVDVSYGLRAARRIGIRAASTRLVEAADQLMAQAQRERRQAFEQGLVLAEADVSAAEFGVAVEAIARSLATRMLPLDEQVLRLLDQVEGPISADKAATARLMNRFASPFLTGSVLVALAGACGSSSPPVPRPDAAQVDSSDTARVSIPIDAPTAPPTDTTPAEVALPQPVDGGCTSAERQVTLDALLTKGNLGYGATCYELGPGSTLADGIIIVLDSEGRVVGLRPVDPRYAPFSQNVLDAALESLANDRWPCLAGQEIRYTCMTGVLP